MLRKGFTLIELLAVIVVLAVIALISTPLLLNIIDNAKKGAFESSVYGILEAGELTYTSAVIKGNSGNVTFTYVGGVESSSIDGKQLKYNGKKPRDGTIMINDKGKIALAIHDEVYCAEKGFNDIEIIISEKSKGECVLPFNCGEILVDSRDGKQYATIQLGEQCWMAEDLAYDCSLSGYNNIGSGTSWSGANNCGNQGEGYTGLLYQWSVAMNGSTTEGSQGLCPSGWYIPTYHDWTDLERYICTEANNGTCETKFPTNTIVRGWRSTDEGTRLKVPDIWNGTNTNGFTALPTGYRDSVGSLIDVGSRCHWWTSTPVDSPISPDSLIWRRGLATSSTRVGSYENSQLTGVSVRCLLQK